MSAFLNANPYQTQSPTNTFSSYTDGVIQGLAMADAASQNWLSSAVLTGNQPMWGGLPIAEAISPSAAITGSTPAIYGMARAGSVTPASTVGTITGFSVFDQAHHGVITPGQDVPVFYPGMDLHFYRFGSNARIPVKASPSLIALGGAAIGSQVSWDFTTGMLQPYTAGANDVAISGITWANGVATVTTSSAHDLASGDIANIAGMVPTAYNGSYPVTVTGAETFTYPLATNPGAVTTEGNVSASGGVLPVRLLEIYPNNCKTVAYNPTTGQLGWNPSDAAALILI